MHQDPWKKHPLPRKVGMCPETESARAKVWWAIQHVRAAAAGRKLEQATLQRATTQWVNGDWEKACLTVAWATDLDSHEVVRAMSPVHEKSSGEVDYYEDPDDDSDVEVAPDGSELDDGSIDW